jgi:hypothetical protein
MKKKPTRLKAPARVLAALLVACMVAIPLAACSSNSSMAAITTNDNTVSQGQLGDLNHVQPSDNQSNSQGSSMGYDSDSQSQQDKTTGGAGGTVTSTDAAQLDDDFVTGGSNTNVEGFTSSTGVPPAVDHGTANGTDCLSCHSTGSGGAPAIPQDHIDAGVTNDQCASCHTGLS